MPGRELITPAAAWASSLCSAILSFVLDAFVGPLPTPLWPPCVALPAFALDRGDSLVDPALDGVGEGPHPAVVGSGEPADDFFVEGAAFGGGEALGLGNGAEGLGVGLPLEPSLVRRRGPWGGGGRRTG